MESSKTLIKKIKRYNNKEKDGNIMFDKKISIAILIGGKSTRFKENKLLYKIGNKKMYEIVHNKFKKYSDNIFLQTSANIKIGNLPPNKPTIQGPTTGRVGKSLEFTFVSTDPEGNDLSYTVYWGDGHYIPYGELYASGEEVTFSHSWSTPGDYTIIVKAMDQYGVKSPQAHLNLKITKSRAVNNPILYQLLEKLIAQFPLLERLLSLI